MQFRHFYGFGTFQYIQLIQFLFRFFSRIVQRVITLDNTGADFDKRIFTQEGVYNGFKYIGRFCLCKVIICLINFVCLCVHTGTGFLVRTWEIAADVI